MLTLEVYREGAIDIKIEARVRIITVYDVILESLYDFVPMSVGIIVFVGSMALSI